NNDRHSEEGRQDERNSVLHKVHATHRFGSVASYVIDNATIAFVSATLESIGRPHVNTRPLMTLRIGVSSPQNIGDVPHGKRRTVPLSGAAFDGPRLRGTVLPEGSPHWLLLRPDGLLHSALPLTLPPHYAA